MEIRHEQSAHFFLEPSISCLQFYLLDFCFKWKYSILGTDTSLESVLPFLKPSWHNSKFWGSYKNASEITEEIRNKRAKMALKRSPE